MRKFHKLTQLDVDGIKSVTTDDRLLSKKEACKLLGITPTTLWRIQKRGAIVPVKFSFGPRYIERELLDFINNFSVKERIKELKYL